MIQNSSVVDKSYLKLVIQVSMNGLSFTTIDKISNKPLALHTITMGKVIANTRIEDLFNQAFDSYPELKVSYDDVVIIHHNNLSTFVPTALFDEEYLGSYLQFNTKVFETDFFAFDELPNYEMNTVYIPYVNMNNYFIDQFGSFEYKHSNTILVQKLLDLSKNDEERKMYVHIHESHFEIIVVQNQKLILFNSFDYSTPEDLLYYILFTAEQLQLNPEKFSLELLGKISEWDSLYSIIYTYVRHVRLLDVSAMENMFTEFENREHFILLHA